VRGLFYRIPFRKIDFPGGDKISGFARRGKAEYDNRGGLGNDTKGNTAMRSMQSQK